MYRGGQELALAERDEAVLREGVIASHEHYKMFRHRKSYTSRQFGP